MYSHQTCGLPSVLSYSLAVRRFQLKTPLIPLLKLIFPSQHLLNRLIRNLYRIIFLIFLCKSFRSFSAVPSTRTLPFPVISTYL